MMFDTDHFDINADNGPLIYRTAIAMIFVSLLGIGLRFYCKRLIAQPLSWDDGYLAAALPFAWGLCIVLIFDVKHGNLGKHVELATVGELRTFTIMLYVAGILYTVAIALTKYSICIFYKRLFHVRNFWSPVVLTQWFMILRSIAVVIVITFPCVPVQKFWDVTDQESGHCINTNVYYTATGATNLLTDLILLAIPIPIIWKLQLSRPQKWAIYLVFLLGGFITVISSLRMVASIQATGEKDVTWFLFPVGFWIVMEANIGIFCACIPLMRPLLRYVTPRDRSYMTPEAAASGEVHKKWWPGASPQDKGRRNIKNMHSYKHMNKKRMDYSIEEVLGIWGPQTSITAANHMELGSDSELNRNGNGILVEREIVWE